MVMFDGDLDRGVIPRETEPISLQQTIAPRWITIESRSADRMRSIGVATRGRSSGIPNDVLGTAIGLLLLTTRARRYLADV